MAKSTRSGKNNSDDYTLNLMSSDRPTVSASLEDIRGLILQSEGRVMAKLDDIVSRISCVESRLDVLQAEHIRVSSEVDRLKETVILQQKSIEKFESKMREMKNISSFQAFLRQRW